MDAGAGDRFCDLKKRRPHSHSAFSSCVFGTLLLFVFLRLAPLRCPVRGAMPCDSGSGRFWKETKCNTPRDSVLWRLIDSLLRGVLI